MSKVTSEECFDLEYFTFKLLLKRVKDETATASEIAQVLKYLGEKHIGLGEADEKVTTDILAEANKALDLPFVSYQ